MCDGNILKTGAVREETNNLVLINGSFENVNPRNKCLLHVNPNLYEDASAKMKVICYSRLLQT
jgi:hypothetical protein